MFFLWPFHLFSLPPLNTSTTSKPMQACRGHACLHAFTCGLKHRFLSFSSISADNPPTNASSPFPFNILLLSHTHTLKARTHSTTTQQEATRTQRSGFTLLGEVEPLRVKTEENHNIETENVRDRQTQTHTHMHIHTHRQGAPRR